MKIIDLEHWPRREIYEHYQGEEWPFYAMSFPVDVTELKAYTKRHGLSFYYSLIFLVTKSMDEVENFRYRDRNGTIILHDHQVPSFTDMRPGEELFHITDLEAGDDMAAFCQAAREKSYAQTSFVDHEGPWDSDQRIEFSSAPWLPMTSVTHDRRFDPSDCIPRVAWGRYEKQHDGRLRLSLALDLNHRMVDGIHVGRFYEALNRRIAALAEEP